MSVNFLATSVTFGPDDFAVIFGIYPIDRTSVGVLAATHYGVLSTNLYGSL